MANAIAHPGGDRLDVEVVTVPDGLEQCDAGGRHPQAGPRSSSAAVGVRDAAMALNLPS